MFLTGNNFVSNMFPAGNILRKVYKLVQINNWVALKATMGRKARAPPAAVWFYSQIRGCVPGIKAAGSLPVADEVFKWVVFEKFISLL